MPTNQNITMKTLKKILSTNDNHSALVARLFLGIVIFPHGAQKLLGWFGGYGFTGTMGFFTETIGLPWLIGLMIILFEFFGAILLILGLGTRLIATFYAVLAFGIVFSSHIQNGFFMNWFGNQTGEGYEYFLLWLGLALILIISGGGKMSLDKKFVKV